MIKSTNTEKIKRFFNNTSDGKTFCDITLESRNFLYQVALYCIDNNLGNLVAAKKILEHYKYCLVRDITPLPDDILKIIKGYTDVDTKIFSTYRAFAALKGDGSVITWGDDQDGGDSSEVQNELKEGVETICSNKFAFAALKDNGSVITWGDENYGGDSSAVQNELQGGVETIYSTGYAFAGLKRNGSIVTWGAPNQGGDSSMVQEKLQGGL